MLLRSVARALRGGCAGPGGAARLAVCVLLLVLVGAAPAPAHTFARLAGAVDVACTPTRFGPVVQAAAFVRNLEFRPIVLTHALLVVETKRVGDPFFRRKAVDNLLFSPWKKKLNPVLLSGEKRVGRIELLVSRDTRFARGLLIVHVWGEPFFRVAVDVDRCDLLVDP